MKIILPVIILFYTSFLLGQKIYHSPMAENLQTGQKEIINKTITIEKETIIIKTQTPEGLDVQTLKNLEKKVNQEAKPPILIYDCTSPDGVYPTLLLIPQRKIISEILLIQPSLYDGSEEHFRFFIESEENHIN